MSEATVEFRAVVASLVVVGIATIFVVLCVWPHPPHVGGRARQTEAQQQQHQNGTMAGRYNNLNNNNSETATVGSAQQQQQGGGGDLNKPQPREVCTKTPDHVSLASAKLAHSGGANLLVDGLVSFRHTKAAASATVTTATAISSCDGGDGTTAVVVETPEQAALNRKERARILSRLLDGSQQPPIKGGTLLVAIPAKDVGCEKLARVLYLLGSFYNLLVILAISPTPETSTTSNNNNNNTAPSSANTNNETTRTQNNNAALLLQLKERLRCGSILLTKDVLPDHRILCASTTTGRVALARQLQRVELILEFDATVRQNLQRFGHTVVLYNNNNNNTTSTTIAAAADGGVSMLGQTLL